VFKTTYDQSSASIAETGSQKEIIKLSNDILVRILHRVLSTGPQPKAPQIPLPASIPAAPVSPINPVTNSLLDDSSSTTSAEISTPSPIFSRIDLPPKLRHLRLSASRFSSVFLSSASAFPANRNSAEDPADVTEGESAMVEVRVKGKGTSRGGITTSVSAGKARKNKLAKEQQDVLNIFSKLESNLLVRLSLRDEIEHHLREKEEGMNRQSSSNKITSPLISFKKYSRPLPNKVSTEVINLEKELKGIMKQKEAMRERYEMRMQGLNVGVDSFFIEELEI
jgi:hypothetical protein